MALAHPLHPIDNRSRNKRRNLWVGRCVSSWWPWFPSRSSVLIYMYMYICMYIPYTSSVIGRIYNESVIQYWRSCTPSRFIGLFLGSARFLGWMRLTDPFMSHLATQLGYSAGEFQALQLIVLLVSWINHLPPACWSTLWKSNFKQQLGWRFDIMDNESYFFVFWHMQLYMSIHQIIFRFYLLKYSFFFFKYSSTNIFYKRSLYTFYWAYSLLKSTSSTIAFNRQKR